MNFIQVFDTEIQVRPTEIQALDLPFCHIFRQIRQKKFGQGNRGEGIAAA